MVETNQPDNKSFLDSIVNNEKIVSSHGSIKNTLCRLIAAIDQKLNQQLSAIIQHPDFKQLEASWRSIYSLVHLPISFRKIKLKAFDCNWNELSTDLNQAVDIKRSVLYRKVYSQELNTAGGHPYGTLLVDYYAYSDPAQQQEYDDLYTLQLLAELGAYALCPVITSLSDSFIGDDPANLLQDHSRVERILSCEDFIPWRVLRDQESSRFLGVVLPQIKIRDPWVKLPIGFTFSETVSGESTLWGNAGYAFVANVLREYDRISWFGYLRSYDDVGHSGSVVNIDSGLIEDSFLLDPAAKYILFAESDGFWSEQGIIPLSTCYLTHQLCFLSNNSVYNGKSDKNRHITTMLQTTLMACRFAHYIKVQVRDKVGSYKTTGECQSELNYWIQEYVSKVDYGEDEIMAKYPLRSADVEITQDKLDPTKYYCEISIQPQYQYDILAAQIHLRSEMPTGKVKQKAQS